MKRIAFLMLILVSIPVFANDNMTHLVAENVCPTLDEHGSWQPSVLTKSDIRQCFQTLEGAEFDLRALKICFQLDSYTNVPFWVKDINACLSGIANRSYEDWELVYCGKLTHQKGIQVGLVQVLNCLNDE